MSLIVKMSVEEKVLVHVNPKTPGGHPAQLDGLPSFEVTSGDVTVEVQPDGISAFIISGDTASTSTVMVTADADLGEGIQTIAQEVSVVCTLANANDLGFFADTPVLK